MVQQSKIAKKAKSQNVSVCVVGAGCAGICMAVKLKEMGVDFECYESNPEVGGTWFNNSYPGAGCDIDSHLYNYSFAKNPNWSKMYSMRDEVLQYFIGVAKKFGVHERITFNTNVIVCRYYDDKKKWLVTVQNNITGERLEKWFSVVVCGVGQLNIPSFPNVPGKDLFRGVQMHSAQWRHDVDLTDKVVVGVGTGPSAIQIYPEVAKLVKELHIVQRSAAFMVPRHNFNYSKFKKFLYNIKFFREISYKLRVLKLDLIFLMVYNTKSWYSVRSYIEKTLLKFLQTSIGISYDEYVKYNNSVSKKEGRSDVLVKSADGNAKFEEKKEYLLKALKPDSIFGCKRVGISDDWFPMFLRENVNLVTDDLLEITEGNVIFAGNKEAGVKADVIIWATGFSTTSFLKNISIEKYKSVNDKTPTLKLENKWHGEAKAYKGICVDEFPNLGILYGPNTNLGHSSIIYMIECQVTYVCNLLRHLVNSDSKQFLVRSEVFEKYNQKLSKNLEDLVFNAECSNWYRNALGHNTNNWSGTTHRYYKETAKINPSDFTWSS